MRKRSRSILYRYGGAVLTVMLATAARWVMEPVVHGRLPFLLFFLAMIFSSWRLGLGPSIAALVLSTIAATGFFILPVHSTALTETHELIGIALFVVVCSSMIAFSESDRRARKTLKMEVRDRRRAERAEKLQADWFRATLISVGDAVITTDANGNVRLLNRIAEHLTGWSSNEAVGKPLPEIFKTDNETTRETIGDSIETVLQTGSEVERSDQTILINRGGRKVPVEDNASPIRSDSGQIIGAVLVFRDISDRRRREAAFKEQGRLAEFGRDIGLILNEGLDLTTTLKECAEFTVKHLDAAFARIWTVDDTGETLHLKASAGLYSHIDGAHAAIPVGRFKIGKIAESRIPHMTNAVIGDPLVPEQEWAKSNGIISFAGYPLVVEDRLIGVMAMFGFREFSDRILKALEMVSNSIALGIRKRWTEQSLVRSERWLKTTLESIGDAVISTDRAGNVRFLNPVAESLTGWTLDEAVGLPLKSIFPIINEMTRQTVEGPIDKVIREGIIVGLANHTLLVRRDGREIPIEDSAAPIRDEDGSVIGIVMVFRDVTDARHSEELLRESEARKAAILETALDAIISIDHTGRVLEFNPAAEAVFRQTRDRMVGQIMSESIMPKSFRAAHVKGLAHFLQTGQGAILNKRIETLGLRSDGEEFPIELAVTKIPVAGPPVFTAHIRDITEVKKSAEERERLLAESQEANQAKTHFLAVLSHELRTPLNPILLVVSSLLERTGAHDALRSDFEMIRQYVNLQARLIDDLLDVMRIVRGKMPIHWEVADAHSLIQQAIGVCRSEVFGKGHTLEAELTARDHHINADPARLQQVLWNLIKNAAKFTPDGGRIVIKTRNEGADFDHGDRFIIEVSDNGIGIESEALARIFDPFQQGETSITRRFGGLGLGLAISKGIVEGHGGLLKASSAGKDQGTSFTIELRTLPEPAAKERTRPSGEVVSGETPITEHYQILLVEDEPATMRLMARLLRSLGHEVVTAGTIGDALRIEPEHNINLIISDIGLPDGSGLEMTKQIIERRGPLSAIALTGYGMEEDILRSREAGFTAHMTKPIDFTKLQAMIAQVMSQGKSAARGNGKVGAP